MKQYKVGRYIAWTVVGAVVVVVGIVLLLQFPDAEGVLMVIPYLCIGYGAGIFGGNLGGAIANRSLNKNPQMAKQMEIEQKDERNQALSTKAKAKAFDMMLWVFVAIIIAFSLMQAGLVVILAVIGSYVFILCAYIYFLNKYHKEM